MSATLSELASALKTRLATISGLRTVEYLKDLPNPPVALVAWDGTEDYHVTSTITQTRWLVWLVLRRPAERSGFADLEAYASQSGTKSIPAALEADQSLGGKAATCIVRKSGPPTNISIGGNPYMACTFEVEVLSGD